LQFHRTGEEPLRDDEISILNGVLELNTKKVETIMTPMKVCCACSSAYDTPSGPVDQFYSVQDVVSLSADTILDRKTVDSMLVQSARTLEFVSSLLHELNSLLSGYSRFPIHEPGKPLSFIGLLLIKKVAISSL